MTTKPSASAAATRKKLLSRVAAAQKQADAAKKTAKLAKLGLRTARDKFKSAKRAAKKLRKAVKALKDELAVFATRKAPRKSGPSKPAARRTKPAPVVVPSPAPFETAPALPEVPPANPV